MPDDGIHPPVPIRLEPIPVDRVWGGDAALRVFGWSPPSGRKIGEWWLLSFRHDHPSIISDGPFAGIPLPQLINAHPELLGEDVAPALLLKVLDSADRLSVQVHPDDALAARMGLESGKTECWYFLKSDEGAHVFVGLAKGVTVEEFFSTVSRNPPPEEMESMLTAVPAREGEVAFIPAGRVHAVGAGVLLLEVQQNADTTFRIYDWGRPRAIHLKEARQAVAGERSSPPAEGSDVLVRCSLFEMRRHLIQGEGSLPTTGPVYGSITCLKGEGRLRCGAYEQGFVMGDTFFLPAQCPSVVVEGTGASAWIASRQLKKT